MSCLVDNHEWRWSSERGVASPQVCTRCGALRVLPIHSRPLGQTTDLSHNLTVNGAVTHGPVKRVNTFPHVLNEMQTPLAIQLYEECVRGKTPVQLSAETGISLDRVLIRILAARNYFKAHVHEVSVVNFRNRQAPVELTGCAARNTQTITMRWSIAL